MQQDLASLTVEQLPAFLAALKGLTDVSLIPVLALAQVAVLPAGADASSRAIAGDSNRPTYVWMAANLHFDAVTYDAFVLEAGATKSARIRKIVLFNPGSQTAGALTGAQLTRTTAAGAGGAVVPPPLDPDDVAFTGILRVNGNGQAGTLGTNLGSVSWFTPAAVAQFQPTVLFDWTNAMDKAPRIKPGAGITFRANQAAAGAGLNASLYLEFTEE
jgi:hypothetical protein